MTPKQHSGETIRQRRRKMGMFQADLASAVVKLAAVDAEAWGRPEHKRPTIDPSLISHWEAGRVAVAYQWRPYVAQVLGLSEHALFGMLEDAAA